MCSVVSLEIDSLGAPSALGRGKVRSPTGHRDLCRIDGRTMQHLFLTAADERDRAIGQLLLLPSRAVHTDPGAQGIVASLLEDTKHCMTQEALAAKAPAEAVASRLAMCKAETLLCVRSNVRSTALKRVPMPASMPPSRVRTARS